MNKKFVLPLIITILFLASCTLPKKEDEVSSGDALRTAAAETVSAKLTEDASITATPTDTPTPTETTVVVPTATATTAVTSTASTGTGQGTGTGTGSTAVPQSTCDSAAYVADITVNDGDKFAPGTAFTKTWQIKNTGTCTWSTSYKLIYAADISGPADLGEPSAVSLTNSVPPGGTIQVSVPLTAASTAGTYRSDWRMQNASGISFKVDAGTIWLIIEVTGSAGSTTPTATWDPSKPTYTPNSNTPTVTATPFVSSASAGLNVDQTQSIDLDTGHITTAGADILFEFVDNNNKFISPQSSATIGYWGGSAPSYNNCSTAGLSGGKVQVINSIVGGYYCYKTASGKYGYFFINSLTPADITVIQTLNIGYNTWK